MAPDIFLIQNKPKDIYDAADRGGYCSGQDRGKCSPVLFGFFLGGNWAAFSIQKVLTATLGGLLDHSEEASRPWERPQEKIPVGKAGRKKGTPSILQEKNSV